MSETQCCNKSEKAAVGVNKKANAAPKKNYEPFWSGPGKGACKMTDLPKPTGCA
ncbi:MAG: hypothetical protein WGN25_20135 [Candidatus Electrothrix sp. GW3-4]|uniref:hypothetical protein n=1 Tax=Candidatus Electrothrix sp. GW3-4 TaxID=3126740 RepID=UPI0030CC9B55